MDLGGEEAICEMRSHPGDKLAQSVKKEKEQKKEEEEEEEGAGSDGSETYFECEEDDQGFLFKDTYFEDEDSLEYVYDPMKLSLNSSYSSQSPFPSSPHQIPPSYGSPFPVTSLQPPSPQLQWGSSNLLGSSSGLQQQPCPDCCGSPGPDETDEDCSGQSVSVCIRNSKISWVLSEMVF